MIKKVYADGSRVDASTKSCSRPLTLTEKILYSHLWDGHKASLRRGVDYVDFAPDRVACQDATAQMALLQFMHAGKKTVAVPTTVQITYIS
jgi:aconitate hydratase